MGIANWAISMKRIKKYGLIGWLITEAGQDTGTTEGIHGCVFFPLCWCSPIDQKIFLGPGHYSEPEQLSLVQIQLN